MTEKKKVSPGTPEWILDEPRWIGPSDEIEEYFNALVSTARAAFSLGLNPEIEILAKWAWKEQAATIPFIYYHDEINPKEYGLPPYSEFEKKSREMSAKRAVEWAYECTRELRWDIWDREERLKELEAEIERLKAQEKKDAI